MLKLKYVLVSFFVLGGAGFSGSGCVNHSDDKSYPRADAAADGAVDDANGGASDSPAVSDGRLDVGSDALGVGSADASD